MRTSLQGNLQCELLKIEKVGTKISQMKEQQLTE